MRPTDYKFILTALLSMVMSLNLSSHSGKSRLVNTTTQTIYTPVEETIIDDEESAVLGNLVWEDINGDGIQNLGEPGIAKVIVKLFDDSNTLQDIKMTNQQGFFHFKNLNEGAYRLEFEKPDGYEFTFCSLTDNSASDSNVNYNRTETVTSTETIHLMPGEKNLSVDVGMFRCVPIGEMVWFDLNRNNIKDDSENGINGLSVEVYRKENNEWIMWDEVFTGNVTSSKADEGKFRACVPPGEYHLKFDMPLESFSNVKPYAGDLLLDSDVTAAHGINTTDSFVVGSGEERLDLGAGYFSLESVAEARLVRQTETEAEQKSPLDVVTIEVYDADDNLVARAKGSEKEKLDMKQFEAEGYYIKFVPTALKRIPAYYAKPTSLREEK